MQTGMIDPNQPAAAPPASSKPAAPSNQMDKNAFLKLLVAQLKNQDPTKSQDPNQMVEQMTSFSTLEQAQNTNALLTGIQGQNNGLFQTNSSSLLGKKVRVASPSFDLSSGSASLGVDLPGAAKVTLSIMDSTGRKVAEFSPGVMGAGSNTVPWDGKDSQGNKLPDGTYTLGVEAMGTDGKPVKATSTAFVKVDGVSFSKGAVMLSAGHKKFSLSDISEISA